MLGALSRPCVINDNPYSESLFHTAKYRLDYPRRTRPVSGLHRLSTGTNIGTAIAESSSSHPNNATTIRPRRSAGTVLSPTTAIRAMVTIDPLLASAGGGQDQSTSIGNRIQDCYVDDGCLNSSRGVIFPGSNSGLRPWDPLVEHAGRGDLQIHRLLGLGLRTHFAAGRCRYHDCKALLAKYNRNILIQSESMPPHHCRTKRYRTAHSTNGRTRRNIAIFISLS
jgi:hypothetical protein